MSHLALCIARLRLRSFLSAMTHRAWVVCLFAFSAPASIAQNANSKLIAQRMVSVYPAVAVERVELLAGVDSTQGIEQIQALPAGAFQRLMPDQLDIRDTSWNRSLWLRITVRANTPVPSQQAAAISVLEIQKPYLDRVTLYKPDLQNEGGWKAQRAGDTLAAEEWSLPGQFPRLALPSLEEIQASPSGQMVIYLHVPHRIPVGFQLKVWTAVQLIENIQQDFLLLGVTIGTMMLAVLLSIVLLLFHRDRLFVWYALYAASALMACVSHSGLAAQYLWPGGGMWPSTALLCFMLLAACSQLQFCKLLFISSSASKGWARACEWLGGLSAGTALVFPLVSMAYWMFVLFAAQALIVTSMLMSSGLIVIAWRHGNRLAIAMALTYLPLFVTVLAALTDGQGWIILPEAGYNAPLYAVALEVSLLGLLLQWLGHERHGQLERERALAGTDPLTGFAKQEGFIQALQSSWDIAQTSGQDASIVYVQALGADDLRHLTPLKLKRCVRLLRTITREGDMVAQLDTDTLGIILPGMAAGNELNERLVRLVALGLIPERKEPSLRFRLVATTCKTFTQPWSEIDPALRLFLNATEPWARKPIHYIPKRTSKVRTGFADSDAMDALWNRALDAQTDATTGPRQP